MVALGVRLAYLVAAQALGAGDVRLYHLQTTATWFTLVGLACVWMRQDPPGCTTAAPASPPSALWLAVYACAGLILYAPAIRIGALSDDFVLMARASAWDFGPVTPILFRPLPLGLWAVLLSAGGGAAALHTLSIVLHGVNAWLTSRLASRWLARGAASHLAGAFMLTNPLHGESVVWLSGIFDVAATTAMLIAVLALRRSTVAPSPRTRVTFALASLAALASKETAVVLPLLAVVVVLPDWRRLSRTIRIDIVVVATATLAYGAVRAWDAGDAADALSVDRYSAQRALFTSLGALAAPWRPGEAHAPTVVVAALLLMALLARAFTTASRHSMQAASLGALWVIVAIAPVMSSLVIGADLEGARYLYAASIGWALVMAGLGGAQTRFGTVARWPLVVAAGLAMHAAFGARAHLGPWTDAARLRDVVLASARADPRLAACGTVHIAGLPDAVAGAYVFRNGAREAFRSGAGVSLDDAATPDCHFRWRPEAGFVSDVP